MQVNVAADELFSNIARYSGASEASVSCVLGDRCASVTFCDNGIPYDPTQREDPDVHATAEERAIGGLGIFMVKKSMDALHYEFVDGCNRLTIEKSW